MAPQAKLHICILCNNKLIICHFYTLAYRLDKLRTSITRGHESELIVINVVFIKLNHVLHIYVSVWNLNFSSPVILICTNYFLNHNITRWNKQFRHLNWRFAISTENYHFKVTDRYSQVQGFHNLHTIATTFDPKLVLYHLLLYKNSLNFLNILFYSRWRSGGVIQSCVSQLDHDNI